MILDRSISTNAAMGTNSVIFYLALPIDIVICYFHWGSIRQYHLIDYNWRMKITSKLFSTAKTRTVESKSLHSSFGLLEASKIHFTIYISFLFISIFPSFCISYLLK
jgi:hypothetical protein